ncbi:DEAD/DEAH box helicase domain protein [Caldivirga maquilingensis IC-167]|uniref:DEAD/DEAH box helicase domain protein n=2 Tax=Caldivirga maquilingensis TaxID=76887 RepID=A8MAW4_CALMQ|nr:DEAD/DEAH box helicase domain protein [Caldivirga maquilingensis IC-167]
MVFNLLKEELRRAISEYGFNEPTEVQRSVIPKILDGFNVAMQARTGSGKTAAYLLPTMSMMKGDLGEALVISPTRELALQIMNQFLIFNKYTKFNSAVVYGGVGYSGQVKALRDASLIVATPGRLLDLTGKSIVDLSNVKYLIIDEVDRMLDMGFIKDVYTISSLTGNRKQTHAATATLPSEVHDVVKRVLRNPLFIRVSNHEYELPMVDQLVYLVDGSWRSKYGLTGKVLEGKSIIFVNTRERAYRLYRQLRNDGLRVLLLHGGMRQETRESTLRRFRELDSGSLISTDLASRGLDIIDVNLILNFDAPRDPETYIHRIGRTARLNRRGKAITLATRDELRILNEVTKLTGSGYVLAN